MQTYQIVFSYILNHGPAKQCKGCPWCSPEPEYIREWNEAAKVFEHARKKRDYAIYRERAKRLKRDVHTSTTFVPWEAL